MGQEELMNKIAELEREIAVLPEGSITKKMIKEYLSLLDLIMEIDLESLPEVNRRGKLPLLHNLA